MRRIFFRGRFIFIPLGVAAFLSLISFVVMQLWNGLLPTILHIGAITFWQAMGIFVLCKLLFGFGRGGGRGMKGPWMRHKMEERFKRMSPEEQEAFREKMKQRAGRDCRYGNRHPFEREWDINAAEEANNGNA